MRGIFAILLGALAFVWPGITLAALVLLFGAWALANGILAIVMAAKAPRKSPGRALTAVLGALSVLALVLTAFLPGITAVSLVFVIASWAIVTGAFEIAAAVQLRREMRESWVLVISGVLSVIFGLLLAIMPLAGAFALVWIIGGYAIAFGILLLVSAARLRRGAHVVIPEPAPV